MSDNSRVPRPDIATRTFNYSLRIIRLYRELKNDCAGAILGKQLLRSGTSIGANVYEAQGGQSRRITSLADETNQIIKILSSILLTAKERRTK